jgi:hypothetical protein
VVVAAALGAEGTTAVLGIVALDAARLPAAAANGGRSTGVAAIIIAMRTAAGDIARPPVGAARPPALLVRAAALPLGTGDPAAFRPGLALLRLFLAFLPLVLVLDLLAVFGLGVLTVTPEKQPGQQTAGKAPHGGAPWSRGREGTSEVIESVLIHGSSNPHARRLAVAERRRRSSTILVICGKAYAEWFSHRKVRWKASDM